MAERCLTYLRDTKYLALMFDGKIEDYANFDVLFKCSCDASYAYDVETRRSTQGYLLKLFGGAIDWKSKKQSTVTTSTTEAELLRGLKIGKQRGNGRGKSKGMQVKRQTVPKELQVPVVDREKVVKNAEMERERNYIEDNVEFSVIVDKVDKERARPHTH